MSTIIKKIVYLCVDLDSSPHQNITTRLSQFGIVLNSKFYTTPKGVKQGVCFNVHTLFTHLS